LKETAAAETATLKMKNSLMSYVAEFRLLSKKVKVMDSRKTMWVLKGLKYHILKNVFGSLELSFNQSVRKSDLLNQEMSLISKVYDNRVPKNSTFDKREVGKEESKYSKNSGV
jgi:hypothetical protein